MSHHGPRLAAVIGSVLMATTLFAAPIAAADEVEDYGAKLKCKYERMEDRSLDYGALRRVVVSPPTIFGERTTQVVGWRVFLHGYVIDDYRSRLQTATAWEGYAPAFEPVKVDLDSPVGDEEFITGTIRMIWYAEDGSKEKVVDHEIGSEYTYVNGRLWWHNWNGGCSGERQLEWVDGP
jgi:hypothetical protein